MKTVFTLYPDGSILYQEQEKMPHLKQLQILVGGYIETVPNFTHLVHEGKIYNRGVAYCNENGITRRLPVNRQASAAWKSCLGKGPFRYEPVLRGNVIFIGGKGNDHVTAQK